MLVAEPAAVADLGLLAPRREREHEPPPHLVLADKTAPQGLDLLLARDKHSIEPRITTSSTPAPGSPSTCSCRSNNFVKKTETSA